MALTDRSHRSRLSIVSTSDGGLTGVTDNSELMNASSEDFAVYQRRVRGYDPVFTYRQSEGAGFKSAPGEDEEKCDRWYRNIDSYPPKAAKSRDSKAFVENYFHNAVAKTTHASADRRRSLGNHVAAKVSFLDDTASSSGRASQALSSTESNRKRNDASRQSSETFSDASHTTSTFSSPSLSQKSRSSTHRSSLSRTSTGTGSTETSGQSSSTASRRKSSHALGRSQRKLQTTSVPSSASNSSLRSVSGESGQETLLQMGRTGTRRRTKARGCYASLKNYWSDRKKRAQKEYRRKERKRLITVITPKEGFLSKMRKYIRNLVWGQPLGDPTVAGHYGTSGTYRPFGGQQRQPMTDESMSNSTRTGSLPSNGPGERAPYSRQEYEGKNVIVCSQKKAAVIMVLVFLGILVIALIAAFARPVCIPNTSVVGTTTVAPPVVTPLTTPDGQIFPWDSVRLPDTLVPHRYEMLMHPNLTTFGVVGMIKIELSVAEETDFIVLHMRNMTITKKELTKSDDTVNMSITRLLLYPERDQMYIALNDSLKLGLNYTLSFEFNYTLKEALEGFYLSHYTTANGSKRFLATTQFEPNAARAAFPCFDEPQLKATFQLAMLRHESHNALFNTPRRKTEDLGFYLGAGIKRDDFFESVRMSTYLVAFIVSDYAHISDTTAGDVLVSVWAPPHLVQQGQFAVEVAVSCLDFYTDYFGIPYQLPKIDLVAIPDFAAGAMENWGLSTFRLTSLLYDSSSSSSQLKEWVTQVVAHELAHQWFGNLVTMRWWNDLWLNEGFATLMEFIGAGNARPEYHMGQQFMLKATLTALSLDSLHDSHPISMEVTDPDEIESIFDAISYSKGAAILYMLMKELGQPVFKAGLNKYLTRHMLGNAQTDDLWAAIQEAGQEASEASPEETRQQVPDIKAMMDSWTQQKNYPLITAVLSEGRLTLRQSPFVMLENRSAAAAAAAADHEQPLWYVPIKCRVHRRAGLLAVRLNNTAAVSVEAAGEPVWYYCNVNKTGMYRVTYPLSNWAALEQLLLAGSSYLSVEDRGAIIDDAFSLNRADRLNATVPLQLSTSLAQEAGLAPWTVAHRHLDAWLQLVYDQVTHAPLEDFTRRLIRPHYLELGWTDTGSHVIRRLRTLVLSWAVSVRLPEAVAKARSLFKDWKKVGLPVPPDLRQLVYATGVEHGDLSDWQFVWGRYINTSTPTEKKYLLMALGASKDPLTIENFLRTSLAGDLVRTQDFVTVVESVATNQAARLRLWRFVRLHWPEILEKFGVGTFMIDNIIQEVVSSFTTQLELDEVKAFFAGKDLRSASRSLQQALESIQLNIRWRHRHQSTVAAWLESWHQRHAPVAPA